MNRRILVFLLSMVALHVNGQLDSIFLRNASFEGVPHIGGSYQEPVLHWSDCGNRFFPGESPPDLHTEDMSIWGVKKKAYLGSTYLGLVTRYNNTWESVSQKLFFPLKANSCYTLHAYLARSPEYASPTKRSAPRTVDFTQPVIIRILGGNDYCEKRVVLASSDPVTPPEWTEHIFTFSPPEDCSFIIIEAYYDPSVGKPYNGHVLIDGLSPIMEKMCD